jgi:hypothetical protein
MSIEWRGCEMRLSGIENERHGFELRSFDCLTVVILEPRSAKPRRPPQLAAASFGGAIIFDGRIVNGRIVKSRL